MKDFQSKIFKSLLKPRTWLYITVSYYIFDTVRFHLSERYRIRSCLSQLKERFEFSGKYKENKPNKRKLCTICPTNANDIEKLMEIANNHGVAINNDINNNSLKYNHIKVDFSEFNKILSFDSEEKVITVEPGIKLSDLLIYLEKYNCTIPKLENYKYSELTVRDVLFNNYYNFIDGQFIDKLINQITLIIPKGTRYLRLKQNDDLYLSDLNLKSLFLRSNSTLGIITEAKINVKKKSSHKFITIDNIQNNLLEVFEILGDLKKIKNELGLKDIFIIRDNHISILLKLEEANYKNCEALLSNSGLHYSNVTEEKFYKSLLSIYNTDNIIRKFKVKVNKTKTFEFLKKIEKYTNENKLPFIFKSNALKNEIELIVKAKDNTMDSIDKGYTFIENIHNWTRKKSMNLFGKLIIYVSR
jgi:hypothetical protein